MKLRTLSLAQLLNFQLLEAVSNVTKWFQNQPNHDLVWNLLNDQELNAKTSVILITTNNDPEIEQEFRTTCLLYKNQDSASDFSLSQAYQEYVNAYHYITSLYFIDYMYDLAVLTIYDTENKRKETKVLGNLTIGRGTCIAQLPNNELFCYGSDIYTETTLIIDSDFKTWLLPPGIPCAYSSAIYFNRNVYCFGGRNRMYTLALSSRFDLDKNRWIKLHSMPNVDDSCHSVIFNGNILISGWNKNILIYSIDLDSFSTISYDFKEKNTKILINAERLYLIETGKGKIYQSKIGDEYIWEIIGKTETNNNLYKACCVYNKGNFYIGIYESEKIKYFKFDLGKKSLSKL